MDSSIHALAGRCSGDLRHLSGFFDSRYTLQAHVDLRHQRSGFGYGRGLCGSRGAPAWFGFAVVAVAVLSLFAGAPLGAEPRSDDQSNTRTNRLINSGNPYLLQHARNPVDWYPWGDEAISAAKRENKPIFLSVGYSTCYWCHVADRTLYSDPAIAKLMNKWFINIKVDREERPDVDETYMLARQLMTGAGGWPNNVFLTPDLKPFFAGSYFPPKDEPGATGFPGILMMLAETWETNPDKILKIGDDVSREILRLRDSAVRTKEGVAVKPKAWLEKAREDSLEIVDWNLGGLLSASGPKFPRSPLIGLFVADYRLNATQRSRLALVGALQAIAYGGIHDHIGGGIHRYSTEPTWSVPHFEKMLYDNAQLIGLYARAYEIDRDPLAKVMAADIAAYLTRKLTSPEGGFYTAEDADINGAEGKSYLWKKDAIVGVLGASSAGRFFAVYELVAVPGERDGPGVLRIRMDLIGSRASRALALVGIGELLPLREKLLAVRGKRVQPARDDKIIVGINGLAISGLARAGKVFERPEWIAAASKAGGFLWRDAFNEKTGRLCRYIFNGKPFGSGFLEDYSHLGLGYVTLFDVTGDAVWLERAKALGSIIASRFIDGSGVVRTTVGDVTLIGPAVDMDDGDTPSGTSAAYALLARLGKSEARFDVAATKILAWIAPKVASAPADWPALVASAAAIGVGVGGDVAVASGIELSSSAHVKAGAFGFPGAKVVVDDRIEVTLTIAPGYHINANPASRDFLVATSVTLPGQLKDAKISYPPGKVFKPKFMPGGISVYEGSTSILIELPKGSLDGLGKELVSIEVQACNDKICLPPATLMEPVSVVGPIMRDW